MRALFITASFPGPFRHIALDLAASSGNRVLFLAERTRRTIRLPGVRRLHLPTLPEAELATRQGEDAAAREMRLAMRRAAMTGNILQRLRREGFSPDVICVSAGGGFCLYPRDIFPDAFMVGYADWFYTHGGNHIFFTRGKPRPPADFAPFRVRNMLRENLLLDCDALMTSSNWQREQFPVPLAERIAVLPEGVDTTFFSPDPTARFVTADCDLRDVTEIVSFCGRTGEPFRGYPQFAQALPLLLQQRPACHAVIMASGTNKDDLDALRADFALRCPDVAARVHVLGFRPPAEYRLLLQASTVHVYLTAPFTLSAGLFEALSCGCLLLGSDTAPVREVVQHGDNGVLCDFWDTDGMVANLTTMLEQAPRLAHMRQAARQSMLEHWDAHTLIPAQLRWLHAHLAARQKVMNKEGVKLR